MINQRIRRDHQYYAAVRSPVLGLIRGIPRRVLELGCGSGTSIERLKRLGCEYVCGIDIREDIAAHARLRSGADEIIVCDIEKTPPEFPEESFDLIVASHVLEHMADPWAVTALLTRWLRPGCQLIGAVPNIRHVSVIAPLVVAGEWRYKDSGIMDWTHLRFFTKQTLCDLLQDCGLKLDLVEGEIGGPKSTLLMALSLGLLREFAFYAYNFSATKSGEASAQSKT